MPYKLLIIAGYKHPMQVLLSISSSLHINRQVCMTKIKFLFIKLLIPLANSMALKSGAKLQKNVIGGDKCSYVVKHMREM